MIQKREFVIRYLKRKNREDLIRNYYEYYEEVRRNPLLGTIHYEKKPTMKEEIKWFNDLLKEVKRGNSIASIAEVDGRVIGLCEIRPFLNRVEHKHIGTLGIAIIEGYRGKGVGSALIEDVLKRARKRYSIVVLTVFGNNSHAQNLYKKFGFKEYGRLPKGIIRNKMKIDDVFMYRELD